ncbi:MAG TPA: tRNA (adenosine(37)-N6)-threonylcarbamoyltransferase complex dimerization subunit type 1 TsaB [candidate division Zixibacteria bacterium]|nr:tRNA (adenosine(37)-N6)-threonylcarbamoyltransferase complex dimerization subunit type 1 TsaB [candidate division Zixibacteria bacterium]
MTTTPSQRYLALDTAGANVRLALRDAGRTIVRDGHASKTQGSDLATLVADTLAERSLTIADLTGLAVSLGPGSFTGTRVGLAFAKGAAVGAGIPLIGVSRFDQALANCDATPDGALIFMKPGMYYLWRQGELSVRSADELTFEFATSGSQRIICIDCDPPTALHSGAAFTVQRVDTDPATLIDLALPRFADARTEDWAELEPIYVSLSSAELKFNARSNQ